MSTLQKQHIGKRQLIPLLVYTVALCLFAQLYGLLAAYELFLQTLVTLFPVVALFALVVLSLACALLITTGLRLWLLLPAHALIAYWWIASFYIQTPAGFRKADVLWDWYNLGFIVASLLPPLLGQALLKLRERRYRKAQTIAQEASFHDAAEILGEDEEYPDKTDELTGEADKFAGEANEFSAEGEEFSGGGDTKHDKA